MLSKNQIHINIKQVGLIKKPAKNAGVRPLKVFAVCLLTWHASIKYATKIKIKASTPPPPK